MATNRVVVLLSDEELAQVQERAGLVPLSAWFRALALGKKPNKKAVQIEQLRATDPVAAERPEIEYGSDELPSGGSVAAIRNLDLSKSTTHAANWRRDRKPLLKPSEKKK